MAEVRHKELFKCTPEEFFKLLQDYDSYSDFLSEVKSCKVLEDNGDHKLVEYKVSVVKDITYVNKQTEVPNKSISWEFKSGDLFKSMKGSWVLDDVGGKTEAHYSIDAEFGRFVPKMITKTVLSVNLPAMMKAYHKRVEELYG